jgi:hypothetical protein
MNCDCPTFDCTCDGHDDLLSGWLLGALTADQATEQVFPLAKVTHTAGQTAAVRSGIVQSVNAGLIIDPSGQNAYVPGTKDCAAAGGSAVGGNVKLAQMAGGLALQGINVAAAVSTGVAAAIGTALGPLTMGISTLIGLFPLLLGHHAAAVKKEQSVLCAAVPAANNYLQIIDQAVQSGQITPQQGISALNSLYNDFIGNVSSIVKGSIGTGTCNAACVITGELHAIIIEKQSQYQDLATAAAQTVTPARPNTTSPAGVTVPASSYASFYGQPAAAAAPASSSDWLPIAAMLALGFLVVRGL